MDRRQLLFGTAVLTLVTILTFDNLLVAQVGNTTVSTVRLSDREKAGLRGAVKTYSDFGKDKAESVRDAEYAADGRLLVWRDNLLTGKVERVYSYDGTGKLITLTSSGSGVTDEFHYDEQGKKTRVRTVPPRSPDRGAGLSGPFVFENAEEGDCLTGGGSVTTSYNDDDQPIESLIRDAHGELLGKIVHNYTNGRLIRETLVWVRLELFQELQSLPEQELQLAKAQMKHATSEGTRPYLDCLIKAYRNNAAGLEAALQVVRDLPLEKRYTWRVFSALKWAFADFEDEYVALDLPHIPESTRLEMTKELERRLQQLRMLLQAFHTE